MVASATWGLWTGEGQEFSRLGLVITAATIPIMYLLAKRKIAVAKKIGSRALPADAMESITCGWLAFVVLAGLVAQLALGAWWVDSMTSLVVVYFLVKEGREAWAVEECGCSSCAHGHATLRSMAQDHWPPGPDKRICLRQRCRVIRSSGVPALGRRP